jgi:hypothetical protein
MKIACCHADGALQAWPRSFDSLESSLEQNKDAMTTMLQPYGRHVQRLLDNDNRADAACMLPSRAATICDFDTFFTQPVGHPQHLTARISFDHTYQNHLPRQQNSGLLRSGTAESGKDIV